MAFCFLLLFKPKVHLYTYVHLHNVSLPIISVIVSWISLKET